MKDIISNQSATGLSPVNFSPDVSFQSGQVNASRLTAGSNFMAADEANAGFLNIDGGLSPNNVSNMTK